MTSTEIKQALQEKSKFEFLVSPSKTLAFTYDNDKYYDTNDGMQSEITEDKLDKILYGLSSGSSTTKIKQALRQNKQLQIFIPAQAMSFLYAKNRYSYKVNGIEVGITEEQLDGMLLRLPSNVCAVGIK